MSTISTQNSYKKRERMLLIIAGVLVLGVLLYLLSGIFGGGTTNLMARRTLLRTKVDELEGKVRRGATVEKKLTDFAARSLPPTAEVATYEYQKWLYTQAVNAGFQNPKAAIVSSSRSDKNTGFRNYSFKLGGQATLQQVANFLSAFYEVNHLHLIKTISLKTVAQTNQLEVAMVVESLSLNTARPSRTISMQVNPAPNWVDTLNEQARYVGNRAFFAPYSPAPLPAPTPDPPLGLDAYTEAFLTYISAVVEVDGVYQVWIERRLTGERLRLFVGDRFELAGLDCKVKALTFDLVTVEVDVPNDDTGEDFTDFMYKVGRNFEQALE